MGRGRRRSASRAWARGAHRVVARYAGNVTRWKTAARTVAHACPWAGTWATASRAEYHGVEVGAMTGQKACRPSASANWKYIAVKSYPCAAGAIFTMVRPGAGAGAQPAGRTGLPRARALSVPRNGPATTATPSTTSWTRCTTYLHAASHSMTEGDKQAQMAIVERHGPDLRKRAISRA